MATKKITTDFLKTVRAKSKEAAAWFRDIVKKTRGNYMFACRQTN